MPSGCAECRELADSLVVICRELEWLISRQKLEAVRHNLHALHSFDPDIQRLNGTRQELISQIHKHLDRHSGTSG